MHIVLGVDVGGSTTKIVAFQDGQCTGKLQVHAGDQLTSLYGAIGHLLRQQSLRLGQISHIVLTGVGASMVNKDVYDIPTSKIGEFEAIGRGGLLLGEQREALVVSMGTGTAFVYASPQEIRHVGGSGLGGGSLLGLADKLIHERDIEPILALAETGDLSHIDLSISDISQREISTLPAYATAANFGKVLSTATRGDLSLGLLNLIFQNAGVMAAFACMATGQKTAVVTGTLATLPQAESIFQAVGELYQLQFIIPKDAAFATAIGAALPYV